MEKRVKNILFYVVIIGGFSALIVWMQQLGSMYLEAGRDIMDPGAENNQWVMFKEGFLTNLHHPIGILLLQIVSIILVARLFSWLCKKIQQPAVVGEIIAGIVLGPSLLGMYFPEVSTFLFPEHSLGNLQLLSQIGLILFMFVVGMELDLKIIRSQAHEAIVISHASIIIPFTLGIGLAFLIYREFAPVGVSFTSFSLFIGISMSITAFPVLARIVQERGIHKSRMGTIVVTCAAADDISAWSLLAVVIAIVRAGSFLSSLPAVLLAAFYVLVMIKLVKPFLSRVGNLHASRENLNKPVVAFFFLILLVSSLATEIIGIHALFGAFMAGVIMPDNHKFRQIFIEKVEDVALVLLLPLFFVYTGLRTQIGLLDDPNLWIICFLVILVAVTGKFAGSALAAKFIGQNWKDSLSIGALMNTRGLVELVALNIGYDLGIMTPEIFAMLVIMALVTTFMTSPALDLIDRIFMKKELTGQLIKDEIRKFRVLVSFGKPEMGKSLLRLAYFFAGPDSKKFEITALHLSPASLLNKYKIETYEKESFSPLLSEARLLNQQVQLQFKVSEDIENDIIDRANKGNYDILLIGTGQSVYKGSLLGKILAFFAGLLNPEQLLRRLSGKDPLFWLSSFSGSTKKVLANTKIPVGVFIDNRFEGFENVLIPVYNEQDYFLSRYVKLLIPGKKTKITIVLNGNVKNKSEIKEAFIAFEKNDPDHVIIIDHRKLKEEDVRLFDLLLISIDSWQKLDGAEKDWLEKATSILILRK